MAEAGNKRQSSVPLILIFIAVLVMLVIWLSAKKDSPTQSEVNNDNLEEAILREAESNSPVVSSPQPAVKAESAAETESAVEKSVPTLRDIVRTAGTWEPAFESWYGKEAPGFELTDIAGEVHKLSDYRGKDVMLVFWATWCPPCKEEIPHLIALQNIMGREKLAIIGISNEQTAIVKSFIGQNPRINYTIIATDGAELGSPYDSIQGIPSAFYVDRQGKIKFATVGVTTLGTIKAIVLAPAL